MPSAFQFIDNRNRLFGREADVRYLQTRAERTGFTALTGPPRMGKTWLLREFCRRTCEEAAFLIGYAESHGEGDLLRAAVADLYLRWFCDSSFGEQAKTMWRSKKDGFFSRFTAKTVEVASGLVEAVPIVGGVAKSLLEGGKTLFAALADADANLRGQNLAQDLTYDQAFETVCMLAEVANRKVVLVLDAFDQIPDPQRQLGVLNSFLSNAEQWPHTHVVAAIRQNEKGEPAGAAGDLCGMFPSAAVRVLERMSLEGGEGDRLAAYVGRHIQAARGMPSAGLAELTGGYPAVVGRWLDLREDIRTVADLVREARNAERNLYPEFERFREFPPSQQRLGMRIAVLRQFRDRDDWELFRPIVLDGLPEADLGHLQALRLLDPTDYPTYGHATRHRGAMQWFAGELPAPLAEETDRMIRAIGARVRGNDDSSLRHALCLQAMAFHLSYLRLGSTAKTVIECIMCLFPRSMRDKSRRDLVGATARAAAAIWPECAALLGMALFNTLGHAKAEDDLPRRDALLRELRDLRKEHLEDEAVRERLAMGLVNTLNDVKAEDDLPRRDALLQELRDLGNEHPEDGPVRKQLAMGLFNTLIDAKAEDDLPRRDALLQELRDLGKAHPDDEAVRERLGKGLLNTLNHAKAEDDLPRRDALLQELRDLCLRYPEDEFLVRLLKRLKDGFGDLPPAG